MRQQRKIRGWDDAIADVKQRIKELEFSLKVFENMKKNMEPWPLAQTASSSAAEPKAKS
jgi:hypothetical protein